MKHRKIAGKTIFLAAFLLSLLLAGVHPALAAPVQQEITPGIYSSEPVVWPDSAEVDFTLLLSADGSAAIITYNLGSGDSYTEKGGWEITEDGLLSVSMTGDEESEYAEPYVTTFAVDGEMLTAVEFDADYFGTEELVLTLQMSEEEVAAAADASAARTTVGGMYASSAMVGEDGGVGMALLLLREDGTAQGNINYFDGASLPDVQLGAWGENGDGTVSILLVAILQPGADGAEVVEIDESIERTYVIGENGELIGENLTLYPVASAAIPTAEMAALSFSSEVLESETTDGLVITFNFYEDGSFEAASDYMNDEAPFMEYGVWEEGEDGGIIVTITGDQDGDWEEPLIFTVEMQEDGSILALNDEVFGRRGLPLYPNEE
jgi:hypothetical protein